MRSLRKQRAPNTLQWLWRTEELREWISQASDCVSSSGPLWINGAPGVGKSIIAAYLVDVLKFLYPDSIVAYFFGKAGSAGLSGAKDVLQTVACQCMQDSAARSCIELLSTSCFQFGDGIGTNLMFEKLVKEPLQCSGKRAFIVLDGLDEVDETTEDEIETRAQLDILLECFTHLPSSRLVLFSRPGCGLMKKVPKAKSKSITPADNNDDIRLYVENELEALTEVQDRFGTLKLDPVEYFVNRSNGVFLWTFLVFERLKLCVEQSQKVVWDELEDIQAATGFHKLDGRFSRALCQAQGETRWIKPILALLIVTKREITLKEVQSAIEIFLRDNRRNFRGFLELNCGSFLRLIPSVNHEGEFIVQLIHETFRSFLLDKERCCPSDYHVDISEAHAQVAMMCLKVMTLERAESNSFVQYAAEHCFFHLHHGQLCVEETGKHLKRLIGMFFDSDGKLVWVKRYLCKQPNYRGFAISLEENAIDLTVKWLKEESAWWKSWLSDQLPDFATFRSLIGASTGSRQHQIIGTAIGKAAAHLWAQCTFSDFNQAANCFCLTMKYFLKQRDEKLDGLRIEEMEDLVGKTIFDGSFQTWTRPASVPPQNMAVAFYVCRKWQQCIYWFQKR
jgi:NACHT domain